MFASGDLSMWVTMSREVVQTFGSINCEACSLAILGSDEGGEAVQQYMRQNCCTEDPWISSGHHPSQIVYGENGYGGHNTGEPAA